MPNSSRNSANDSLTMSDRKLFIAKVWLTSSVLLVALFIAQFLILAHYSANNNLANSINVNLNNSVKVNLQKLATGDVSGRDAYVQTKMSKLFTSDEIMKISSSFWSYQLLVDGKSVTADKITASSGNLTITVIQKEKQRILPVPLHVMGMVTGGDKADNYYEHVSFTDMNPPMTQNSVNGVSTANYVISNVKPGQSIPFSISPMLESKLGLTATDYTVSIK